MYCKTFILSLLITSFSLFAKSQELPIDSITGKVSLSRIIEVEGQNAEELFKKNQQYAKTGKQKFYSTNGERNKGWEFALGVKKAKTNADVNNAKEDIGFYDADKETNTVIAKCVFRYEGSMVGCPRLLLVEGDLLLKSKDGRVKFDITNLHYNHYNISSGKPEQLYGSKDKGPCSSFGSLEDLLNCNHCNLPKFYDFFVDACSEIKNEYKRFITTKTTTNENW